MNDCPNAEIRDRLPDLLHERLDPAARAEVVTHVEGCLDCRAELELLRQLRVTLLHTTPRVDVARIVAALPSSARVVRRHRTWVDWRIAAAVTVIAIGGGSAVVLSHRGSGVGADSLATSPVSAPRAPLETTGVAVAQATPVDSTAPRKSPSTEPVAPAPNTAKAAAQGLDMTGRLGDLSDDELQALLGDISKMDATPMVEPEHVAVPITTRNGTTNDEGVE